MNISKIVITILPSSTKCGGVRALKLYEALGFMYKVKEEQITDGVSGVLSFTSSSSGNEYSCNVLATRYDGDNTHSAGYCTRGDAGNPCRSWIAYNSANIVPEGIYPASLTLTFNNSIPLYCICFENSYASYCGNLDYQVDFYNVDYELYDPSCKYS